MPKALHTNILPPWFPYSGKQSDTWRPHFPAQKTEDLLLKRYKKNDSVCGCCVDHHRLSNHSLGQWHIFNVKFSVTHWPCKGYQSLILWGVLPRATDRLHDRTQWKSTKLRLMLLKMTSFDFHFWFHRCQLLEAYWPVFKEVNREYFLGAWQAYC